jgi:cytochrome c-type biogenesis protein CcmE
MEVSFSGILPGNFYSASLLVVTGKYHNGMFEATEILTKCPSKYEGRMK